MTSRPEDLDKPRFFAMLGFGGDPAEAEAVLIDAGLTNPRKPRISAAKLDKADALLRGRFVYVCQRGDCQAAARRSSSGRTIVRASAPEFCMICGGSANQAEADRMVAAFVRAGWSRLCVVGGSPAVREELERLIRGRLELRLVDGTLTRTRQQAADDLNWADRAAVWASTQLNHRVSDHYRGPNVRTVQHRGLQRLCGALADDALRAAG